MQYQNSNIFILDKINIEKLKKANKKLYNLVYNHTTAKTKYITLKNNLLKCLNLQLEIERRLKGYKVNLKDLNSLEKKK